METPVLVAKGWRSRLVAGVAAGYTKLGGVREKKFVGGGGSLALVPIVMVILN
jgi:hypothetical protein